MLNRLLAGITSVAMVVFCLAAASVSSAPGEPKLATGEPGEPTTFVQDTNLEQSYIGKDRCYTCHRTQSDTWSETKHAQAFDILPEKYRDDSACLKCHVTALGETGGFVPGMTAEEAQTFLSVGCEVCHGPGALHEDTVKRWTLADPAEEEKLLGEIKTTIRRIPTDSQCAVCHTSQAHQSHPPYDGQPQVSGSNAGLASATLSPPPTRNSYNVKTCASCHYGQYKQWRLDKHAGLAAKLPAKYQSDGECQKCHPNSPHTSQWYTPSTNPQTNVNQLTVACESCHGSGHEHVLFNKQYISGPRLSPELEQAARLSIRQQKPASACLQCHIREGHQEHSEYEKPEVTNTK